MLDIKLIRENPDFVKEKLTLRGENTASIDKIGEIEMQRLELMQQSEKLKELRNKVSDEIAVMKRNKQDATESISKMKEVGEQIKSIDEEIKSFDIQIDGELRNIPNLPHDSVPVGKSADENVEVKIIGDKREFDFNPLDHIELGKKLDIFDFERGAKITGSGFPLYKGKGAILERALINFMLDTHTQKNGYSEVITPVLASRTSMEAAEKVPKFEDDMYLINDDDLFAIPTAEVPILNIHRDEILETNSLPVKYCGYTTCFRREAGSYGKETRGLLRVHQFNKVELFNFCKPEDSYDELEKMLKDACGILDLLKIRYRVLELCTGDLGFAASKCYDIEVWAEGENKWLEASSVSNCTDFQTRRAKIRFKRETEGGKSKPELTHALNGSGLATSRLMVALVEAYQTIAGTILIPDELRKYTGFDEIK